MNNATTGHETLSFINCTNNYNQIQMALEDQEAMAFHTLKGIFWDNVMHFGLKNIGETYQKVM